MSNMEKERAKLLADLAKKIGNKDDVYMLGDMAKQHPSITTGILSLDKITGIGGYPRGRIIEMYGPESSGKTTVALAAAAEVQKNGGQVVFVDAENAANYEFVSRTGVNVDELIIITPETAEIAFESIITILESPVKVDLIIMDSLAALTPEAELDGKMDDHQVSAQARVIAKGLRKINSLLNKSGTVLILLNQLRDNMNAAAFGVQFITPGGRSPKFYASMRIRLQPVRQLKRGDAHIGNILRFTIDKNKMGPPRLNTDVNIHFMTGISNEHSVINEAVELKLLDKKPGSRFWADFIVDENGEPTHIHGEQAMEDFLRENEDLKDELINRIRDRYKKEGIRLSGEEIEADIKQGE